MADSPAPQATATKPSTAAKASPPPRSGRKVIRISGADRGVIAAMVGIPTVLVVALVVLPAFTTVILSFAKWTGIGGLDTITWVGTGNYENVFTNYPPFWPAIQHNVIWLGALFFIATPFGMFLAVLLDKEIRGSRFYQTAIYLPVVLSLALVGFIWQLFYSRDQGLLNAVLHTQIDWYGDSNINLWAVLVAAMWRHVGYIMLLYLAGLKGVDPSLREAAAMDGAGQIRTFFQIVFPILRPINIIVMVITVIEALRAFDLVWVVNQGRNGLELISALVTQNVIGEASRIGFGSALATIMLLISLVFVSTYVITVVKGDEE